MKAAKPSSSTSSPVRLSHMQNPTALLVASSWMVVFYAEAATAVGNWGSFTERSFIIRCALL